MNVHLKPPNTSAAEPPKTGRASNSPSPVFGLPGSDHAAQMSLSDGLAVSLLSYETLVHAVAGAMVSRKGDLSEVCVGFVLL